METEVAADTMGTNNGTRRETRRGEGRNEHPGYQMSHGAGGARGGDYQPKMRVANGPPNPRANHQMMERRNTNDNRPEGLDGERSECDIPTQWFEEQSGNGDHPIVPDI